MNEPPAWKPGQLLVLESKRFNIRSMIADDVSDEYISWWNDTQIMDGFMQAPRNWTKSHGVKHVNTFNNKNSFHLGIHRKGSNEDVGFIAIFHNKGFATALINMIIGNKKYWGARVPKEIVGTVFPFIFDQLRVAKIKTETAHYNRSSVSAMLKVGFVEEGILRQEKPYYKGGRIDMRVFGLLAEEWQAITDK
jgi:RimJ/RimL family protein N-acetyltransferase